MKSNHVSESRDVRNCRWFSWAIGGLSVLVGGLALTVRTFPIPILISVLPALATMKPNTALCFVLAGLSLWLLRLGPAELRSPRTSQVVAGQILAGVVSLVALLTLVEYLFHANLGLDALIFHQSMMADNGPYPDRMSAATALGFLLLGGSLLSLEGNNRRRFCGQGCALLSALDGLIAVVGYLYSVRSLYGMFAYSSMALHTGGLFVLLGLAVVAARPQAGLMAAVTSQNLGGLMARRILPLVAVLPILIGWVRWRAQRAGYFDTAFGLAIFALSNLVMFATLLWVGAFWINRVDERRQRAEETDLRLAAIVESSTDAIVGKSLNGTITSWNQSAQRLFGYSAEEIVGCSISRLIPLDRRMEEQGILRRIRNGERVEAFETVRIRKDGRPIEVSASISPIRGLNGQVTGAAKIARDITEHKQAQRALQESEERLRLFVEHAPTALAMFDRKMRYLQVSRRWLADYDLGDRDLRGISHYEIFPEVSERWKEAHRRGLAGEVVTKECEPFKRADGTAQWIRWEVRPWYDTKGEIGGIVIFTEDITARQRSQEQLALQAEELSRQAEELIRSREALAAQTRTLQSVLDNIADGLIATDAQGKFLLWNPAADRILGQGKANIPPPEWSRHYRVFLPDGTTPFPVEELPLAQGLRGREASCEMFIRGENSQSGAWIEASAQPMRNEKGTVCGAVVAFRDITRRVQADRAIRELNNQLERRVAERTADLLAANQELEAFSYSVSHDLRAPLRHILGFVQILGEDFGAKMEPEARGYLKRIEDGAHNLTQLVDEMLNLSRVGRQALNCQPTALNQLVEEVITILQSETVGRQIEWKIAALPTIECDPTLIKQVFQNLLSNALKYSRTRPQTVIEIGEVAHEGAQAIFVCDNGVGFDMKYADKLFGVFQRLHKSEEFEGTGVGLATVSRIIQKHGGRIWAEAEPGRGATFYFTLAVSQPLLQRSATSRAG